MGIQILLTLYVVYLHLIRESYKIEKLLKVQRPMIIQ